MLPEVIVVGSLSRKNQLQIKSQTEILREISKENK